MKRGQIMSEKLLREFISNLLNEETKFRNLDIIDRLQKLGYTNLKAKSGKTLVVLLDDGSARSRLNAMSEIEEELSDLGAKWDRTPVGASSIGLIFVGESRIMAKPAGRQGRMSGGLDNEDSLRQAVDSAISESGTPITVKFVGGGKDFVVEEVIDAKDAGSDTKGRKKSDLNLITKSGTVPISIKKDNAQYWESADTYWGETAAGHIEDLVGSGKIEMVDKGGYYNVLPNFAVRASPQERVDVVFGSDILGNGVVVKRTFSPNDFSYDTEKNMLIVSVSEIVADVSDLDGSPMDVWFLVRNDKTRNSVPGYRGIRVLAAYEKRINPNVLRVE